MVAAIERQVADFEMPGAGIPDFSTARAAIADAGVYDFASHHDQILVPVILKHWRIEQVQNLKAAAEQARERLLHHMERMNSAPPSGCSPVAARRAAPRDLTGRFRSGVPAVRHAPLHLAAVPG